MLVTIVDYGVGNLASVKNMIKKIGFIARVSDKKEDVEAADKIILPGVGSFDYGIQQLRKSPFFDTLNQKVLIAKTPLLGICLGMQLLTESSEEGNEKGLGWIKGKTILFRKENMPDSLRVPHMGWTDINISKKSHLFGDIDFTPRYYFVHSYHVSTEDKSDVLCEANYGYDFTAAVEKENIYGVQFHPEKSHKFGMQLLENFIKYC